MPLNFLKGTKEWKNFIFSLKNNEKGIKLSGVSGQGKPYILALLARESLKPIVFIRPSTSNLIPFDEQCRFFFDHFESKDEKNNSESLISSFPALTKNPYQEIPSSMETVSRRMHFFYTQLHNPPKLTISNLPALLKPVPNLENMINSFIEIWKGGTYKRDHLLENLNKFGYSRENLVNSHGEYAWRGGIVDIFSPWTVNPYRIEFSEDSISSIREFNASSQRSIKRNDFVLIPSLYEFNCSQKFFKEWESAALQKSQGRFLRDIESKSAFLKEHYLYPQFSYDALLKKINSFQ